MLDAGGQKIFPRIGGLLIPTGVKPTSFQNSVSKVAGLQVHPTTNTKIPYLGHM